MLFDTQVTLSPLVCKVAKISSWRNNLASGKGKIDTVYSNLL